MAIRITGGSLGGRFIDSPSGGRTRPTASITRQALFNVLASQIQDAQVLDLFAGTGVVAIEALSRGAQSALCVEKDRRTADLIKKNCKNLNLESAAQVLCADVFSLLKNIGGKDPQQSYDLIYADPPFIHEYPDLRPFLSWRKDHGIAVFEMPSRSLPAWSSEASELRRYGESTLALFF